MTASSLRSFTESLRDPVTDSGPTLSLQHLKVYILHKLAVMNTMIGVIQISYCMLLEMANVDTVEPLNMGHYNRANDY